MMIRRLVGFDKIPGVRPLRIGDIIRRLVAKCGLAVAGQEAMRACGTDTICTRLEAWIEGGIHFIHQLQNKNLQDQDPWGMFLIDAHNTCNKSNKMMMLWVAHHEWPSGCQMILNFYRHHSSLVIRGEYPFMYENIQSMEGVTQGCPFAMVGYSLLVLPLIRQLQWKFPNIASAWYTNNAMADVELKEVIKYFNSLCELGPS